MLRYPSSEIRITTSDVENLELLQRQLATKLKQKQQEQEQQDEQSLPSSPLLSFTFNPTSLMLSEDTTTNQPIDDTDEFKPIALESSKRKRTIQEQRNKMTRQRLGLDSAGPSN